MAAGIVFKSPLGEPGEALDRDDATYVARFTASIDTGLADADTDDVMSTGELEAWLAARRSERAQGKTPI